MDAGKIGTAIKTLRMIEGYTQQELAQYLNVTDKAVSKWERGLSIPDISIVTKLAGILNTDVDNLLEGNIAYLEDSWHGVLRIEPMSHGLHADARAYDKRLMDIWLSYFILAGIRDVMVFAEAQERRLLSECYGDGSELGLHLTYHASEKPSRLLPQNMMIVYGNVFLYGANLTRYFQRAMSRNNGMSWLAVQREEGRTQRRLSYDKNHCVVAENGVGSCCRLPVAFCPARLIAGLEKCEAIFEELLKTTPVYVEMAGNGLVYDDVRDYDALNDVANFLRLTEKMTGNRLYDVRRIAVRRGFLPSESGR